MTTVFATVALVFGVVRLALFVALHVVKSEYNIVEHAVSDYAVGPTRTLSSIMTWVTAGLWGALALAVSTGFPDWDDRTKVTIFLIVLAAIAWFALSYACMSNFVNLLRPITDERWDRYSSSSRG